MEFFSRWMRGWTRLRAVVRSMVVYSREDRGKREIVRMAGNAVE